MTSSGWLKAIIAGCAIGACIASARADDASAWANDNHAAFRLIAGDNDSGMPVLRAGVQIKLDPGWKTYWRYPGDAGVPPHFDFSRSENVTTVKVLYPAPHLFTDDDGNSIGYKDGVTFPLRVTPKQTGKPVKLRLKLDYAVCEKLCVPAEGVAELTLPPGPSAHDPLLAAAEKRVPKPLAADQMGLTVHRVNHAAKPLIMVDLKAPPGKKIDVFVEGPTSGWALPVPKPAAGAPEGHQQFSFELDGLPPGVDAKDRFDLVFTIVEGDQSYEVKTRLD